MENKIWSELRKICPDLLAKYESLIQQTSPPFWIKYDILDIYVLGIIFFAFLIVFTVKIYIKYLPRNRDFNNFMTYNRKLYGNPHFIGESAQWVNNLIEWIKQKSTAFTDAGVLSQWAKLLTEEAEKIDRYPELKIVRIAFQNNLSFFTDFQTIQTCEKYISVHCFTSISELPISLILYPSGTSTPLDIKFQDLEGSVKFRINGDISCVDIEAKFTTTNQTKLITSHKVAEINSLERKLMAALTLATLNFRIPLQFNLSDLCKLDTQRQEFQRSVFAIQNALRISPHSSIYSETSLFDNKLLIKIIKACNLKDSTNVTYDPYCMISVDEPYQRHTTSVVRNTCNPFFDEHYIL